jgi:hypothetical protein
VQLVLDAPWPWTHAAICDGDASCEGIEVMM